MLISDDLELEAVYHLFLARLNNRTTIHIPKLKIYRYIEYIEYTFYDYYPITKQIRYAECDSS